MINQSISHSFAGRFLRKITRRDLAVAGTAVLATAVATAAVAGLVPAPARPVTHSSVYSWDSFKAEPTKTGSRRECLDVRTATLDRLETHVTTLNPGQAPHGAHKHPEEEIIVVREGALEVFQNGQTNRVEAGGIIFQGSNEMHGLKSVGTKPAVYYVVKFFPPGLVKDPFAPRKDPAAEPPPPAPKAK